jgi:hypothetical protein
MDLDLIREATEVLHQASAVQLLKLAKLLGDDHVRIAEAMGVSCTAISLWLREHRPIPDKYRDTLLAYDTVALRRALEALQHDMQALPTAAMQQAAREAFHAPLHRWALDVVYDTGRLLEGILDKAQRLVAVLTHEPHSDSLMATLYLELKDMAVQQAALLSQVGTAMQRPSHALNDAP